MIADTKRIDKLDSILASIKEVLFEKNKRYGNAALEPLGVFYKGNAKTSICIRLDDKLSRIKNSSVLRKNDLYDLLGYCVLYIVSQNKQDLAFYEKVERVLEVVKYRCTLSWDELVPYNSFTEQDIFNGFTKKDEDTPITKCLNSACATIKQEKRIKVGSIINLIGNLVEYFIQHDITDFSDLID